MQKIQVKISLNAIRNNAKAFKKLTKTRLCAVVKANAYGHGAEEVVCALQSVADCFAVALVDEGISIRGAACGKDILVFTPPLNEEEVYMMAVNGFTASVTDLWTAKLLSKTCAKFALPIQVHLKVNTGMNRYGMDIRALGKTCKFLQNDPYVKVVGLYSHLYGDTRESAYRQRAEFLKMQTVCRRYFPDLLSHLSATFGALLGQNFRFDMVRIGLGLYGYLPKCQAAEKIRGKLALQKGMFAQARIVVCRALSVGGIGYGKTYTDKERKAIGKVSVCRFGYADGFLRRRENGVADAEKNAGSLCMDVCIRKQTGKRGAWLPVLTDAEEIAEKTETIAYEVLCAATRRAEIIYEDG